MLSQSGAKISASGGLDHARTAHYAVHWYGDTNFQTVIDCIYVESCRRKLISAAIAPHHLSQQQQQQQMTCQTFVELLLFNTYFFS